MYVNQRVLYDTDGNPCNIGDTVRIIRDNGQEIIDTIVDISDEQDKGMQDNDIYLRKNGCIPIYCIEEVYKFFPNKETRNGVMTRTVAISIDIRYAKVTLAVAGFDTSEMSDDEVFEKVLTLIDCYGARYSIID